MSTLIYQMHKMPIFTQILTGKIPLFAWDAYFYIGINERLHSLLKGAKFHTCMGCLFSQRDAHAYLL